MSKSVELDKIIDAVTHDVGYPGEGPTTLGDWAEEFARRVLSIQQEADAKDAARWRESTKGKPLLVECRNRSGKPITVSIGCREECVDWPEKYTAAIDTAMATPTDSEDKTSA